ncbi:MULTISPECIES: Ig-like domain-containing protein [unclassified Stenotrophomonas]|uniref:Ig-like domain-containing protein n=1 Tax=unclassified Stenotrophomonas TaxID=196198 RepID=UPI003012F18F
MSTASARRFLSQLAARCLRARALPLAGIVLMTLAASGAQAQAYRNPLVNTATVAAPADISDPTPGNNTSSDSNTLAASAQLSVSKTITTPTPVAAGGAVQYRIELRNQGPSQAVGATLVDSVPAQLTAVSWTCAVVSPSTQCAAASGTGSVNIGVNVGVGEVLVVLVNGTAPTTTPATIAANVATITPPLGTTDPTPGDNTATTPSIPVQAAALIANDDDFRAAPLPPGVGGITASVLTNDTLNGVPVVAANMVLSLTSAPSGYSIAADGTVNVPATAAAGPVTLTYQLCEQASPANCDTANVLLVVGPNAVDDSYAVQAGAQLVANVRDNDNYVVDSTFTQTGTAPTQGTLQLLGDGSFTYTANAGATGTDTFSYQLCLPAPNGAACDTATVTLNINASVIDAVADDFTATPVPAQSGGTLATSVLANDTFDGNPVVAANLTTTLITAPAGYVMDAGGFITVPAGTAAGAVTLAYRICLTSAPTLCDTANVQLVVGPDAVDDAVTTPGAGQPALGNVGTNDIAAPGAAFSLVTPATQGTAVIGGDGAFTYTPNAGAAGTDTFSYQVCLPAPNGTVCDTATVTVTLGANALLANDDTFATAIPGAGGTTPSVLGNDTLNGSAVVPGTVTATLLSTTPGYTLDPTSGTIAVAANIPAGLVTLSYRLCEVAVPTNCDDADVQLVVSPTALADTFNVQAGQSVNGLVAINDNAPAGSQYFALTAPTLGSIDLAGNGALTYTANPGTTGTDTFDYRVCLPAPNGATCATATVSVIIAANTIDAVDDVFTAPVISPVTGGSTASVLGNDTFNAAPVTAAQVTLSLVNAPPPGFTITSAGVINVPAGAAAGAVSLTYELCEAGAGSNCDTAQVALLIAPAAADDTYTTPAGQPLVGDVSINDNAPAGASYTLVTPPAAGSFTLQPNGSFTYTPAAAGPQTVQYQVCLPAPDAATCDTGTVNITVVANTLDALDDNFRAPVFAPGVGGTTPSVLGNDTFNGAAANPLQVTVNLVGAPAGFSIDGAGVITVAGFAPAGATTLSYALCELGSTTNCDTADVQVLIAPDAADDTATVTGTQPGSFNLAANDNVPAGATFTVTQLPTKGVAVLAADGTLEYTANAGQSGADTLTYQVCLPAPDGATCDTAQVAITIAAGALVAVNDDYSASPIPPTGGSTPSVLLNDTFNGAAIVPGTTPVTASLTTLASGYSMAANGVISVAAGTLPGSIALNYQVCETALPSNCATATAVVVMSPDAVNDVLPAAAGATTVLNVLANDVAPLTPVLSVIAVPANGNVVVNGDGTLSYTPTGAFVGPDTFTYQLCLPAPHGSVCDTATVALTVTATTVTATNDDFTASPIPPAAGGSTASVLLNDTFNGAPIVPGTTPVTATLISPVTGYTMAANGVVSVAPGTTPAAVTLSYQVCETALPTNCAAATALVAVSPDATDDTLPATAGTANVLNVLANDSAPLNPVVTVVGAPANGTAVANGDGSITYTPTGAYTGADSFTYQVCLPAPGAGVCDTATVSLTVSATTLTATNDDFTATPIAPATGGSTTSVLLNDSFNGVAIIPGTTAVTASLSSPVTGYSMAANGVITVAAGTTPAAVTLNYQVCENAVPTNCAGATAVVAVSPDAVDDALPATAGATTVLNVLANDTAPLAPTVTIAAAPTNGTALVNGDGTVSYTPTAGFTGADSFTYQVCLPAPAAGVCDTATVAVTVGVTSLTAAADDFTATPIAPAAGGSTASVLLNDTFNGAPIVPGTTPVTATLLTVETGYSMAADGVISVAPGTTPAAVTLNYLVCETAVPTNCAAAAAVVAVSPDAVDDTLPATAGTATVLNVGANDTLPANPSITIAVAPANGVAVVNGDGTITYTPTAGFTGADTFSYQVCLPAPGASVCDTASVAVTVSLTGLAAVNDDFTNAPITPATGGSTASVLLNDTFNGAPIVPGTTPVTATLLTVEPGYSMAGNGVVTVAAGTTPAAVTLNYQVCENAVPTNCAGATVVVAVSPDAVADALPATAGTTTVLNVLANDAAPLNPVVTLPVAPTNGSAVVNGDGTISYTPTAGYTGPDSFTYQLCLPAPGGSVCDTATVTLTVSATTLTAVADDFTAAPIAPATGGSTASVLLNDTFNGAAIVPGTTAVTASLLTTAPGYTMAGNGVVTVAAGTTPAAVTLNYQVCENAVPTNCAAATVLVAVSPDAVADALPATAGTTTVLNVLANDSAPLNPVVTLPVAPTNGTAVVNGDGTISYTPTAGYTGPDSFTYQLCLPAPGGSVCDTATVTLTVSATTLTAVADDFTAAPIAPATGGSTASVLLNDTFNGAAIVPGTTPVAASLVTPVTGYSMATNGVVSVAPGTTPAAVTLSYQVCEVAVPTNCAQSTAVVAVSPVVVDDTLTAAAGTTTVLNVIANDTLPVNPTITVPAGPANGTVIVNGDGTISYTPNTGYTGPDSFTYQACLPAPGAGVCDTATVSITVAVTTVTAVADDFSSTPIAPAAGGSTPSVLLNDTFNGAPIVPGTTPVTASLVGAVPGYSMAANGVVTVAAGTTPAAVTLNYQVCETAVPTNCAQSTALVAVSPAAADDTLSAAAGTTTVLAVTANDTLPLNPTITIPVAPANGTAVVNPDGSISYTPTAGFTGADSFTYQVCLPAPNGSVCDTASVSLTVTASALVAQADDFSGAPVAPTGGTTASVLLNDTFNGAPIVPGTTPVTASLVGTVPGYSMAANGVVTVAPGTLPAATTLTYQVCENAQPGNCAQATALVAVRPDAADDALPAGTGTTVLAVAANDTLPVGAVFTVPVPPANGTAVVNGDNTISYTPNAGFTGTDTFTYQACLPAPNLNVCDTATVSVTVTAALLDAVDDTASNVPATGALGLLNVFANDTFNGAALDPATVVLTPNNTTALTIQPNGSLDVAAGTPGVTYTTTYRLCLVAQPTVCDIGTVSVTLATTPGLLDAVDDTVTNVPAAGANGVANVLANDTYNSAALDPATVVLTPVNTAAITIQPNGSVNVAAGTPGTTYTTTYQICLVAQPAVCDIGTVSVTLASAGVLVANDDSVPGVPPGGATGVTNVLTNDTLNGTPVDPSTVVLTPTNTPALTIQPDGSVDVTAGTPGTTYTTTYQICLVAQPTICAVGTVSVTLAAAPNSVPVANNDQASTPQDTAVDVPVLANDLVNGAPVDPGTVAVTITTAPTMGTAVVLPDGSVRYTPMTHFSGADSFTYSLCNQASPAVCSSATVNVQTQVNDVDVVDENITVLSGTTTTVPLLDNLTTSGARINPASMRLGRAAGNGRATCGNGECIYTAFVGYSGLDNFSYNICDASMPTPVCVEGWVNVVVTADAVVLRLTKQATQRSVKVGDVVRYVVTVENMGDFDALGVTLFDTLPSGFTFIPGGFEAQDIDNAARASGVAPLRIDGLDIRAGGSATLVYYLRVGAGVGLGVHTNRITANDVLGTTISNVASADVEVIGDPLLDESLVIGSVFNDRNGNGVQDAGERGIPGVRVASVEGLVIETDAYGRYHLVGINGGQARGRNFILKVDPTTLPADARFTTRNPLLRRITPGLPVRFDFGVALPEGRFNAGPPQSVLEVGEGLFVPGQATLGAAAETVLAHAARTLEAQGGGQVNVAAGQATPALAGQRAEVLRKALLPRLPADVAARVQVQVQPAAPARPADRADR